MKIGIFGGSFDPVHKGHRILVEQVNNVIEFDKIYIIPTRYNPWKESSTFSSNDRKSMLEIAFSKMKHVEISTIELDSNDKKNYSIDTIEKLKLLHPNDDLYYIMGMDQVVSFNKWYKAKEISELVSLICVARAGYQGNENIRNFNFRVIEIPKMEYSSTRIRNNYVDDMDIEVMQYLVKNSLYLENIVRHVLSTKRSEHSISVANLAASIAASNGLDEKKAYIAGMLHDIAKEMDKDSLEKIMKESYLEHIDSNINVWHQWVSSYQCQHMYGIDDKEILQAIKNHTTAATNMTPFDMCIYIADKYDPLRGFDSNYAIELAKKDVVEAFRYSLKDFHQYALKKNIEIDDVFYKVYNKYVKEK